MLVEKNIYNTVYKKKYWYTTSTFYDFPVCRKFDDTQKPPSPPKKLLLLI